MMPTQAFSYTKIVVADIEASEAFYGSALGMTTVMRGTMGETDWAHEECVMTTTGEMSIPMLQLIRYHDKPVPAPTGVWLGFNVTDLDAVIEKVRAAGGSVLMAPKLIEEHNLILIAAVVADPEGHMIELIEMLGDS